MNIHPIFVHFPIALLTLYSLMEIFHFTRIKNYPAWNWVKSALLILGTLSGFITLQTGELAEEVAGHSTLIELHSTFASISIFFFAGMSALYIIWLINNESTPLKNWFWNTRYVLPVWRFLTKITDWIMRHVVLLIVAGCIGLALITITGALGGAIVYGHQVDPVVSFIYNLFF